MITQAKLIKLININVKDPSLFSSFHQGMV